MSEVNYYINDNGMLEKYFGINEVIESFFYDYEVINKRITLIKILTLWLQIFDIALYEKICNEGLIERAKEDDDGLIDLINYSKMSEVIKEVSD